MKKAPGDCAFAALPLLVGMVSMAAVNSSCTPVHQKPSRSITTQEPVVPAQEEPSRSITTQEPVAPAQEEPSRSITTQVPVIFGDVPTSHAAAIAFDPGEAALTEEQAGIRTTLFGRLHDTSVINTFHAYWYDGRRTANRRYYVKGRFLKRPLASIWVTVDATITRVDARGDDKHEIQIHSYRELSTKETRAIDRALAKSRQWTSDNREMIDLNQFKKDHSRPFVVFQEKNWEADFDKTEHRDIAEILSLDMKRGVAEFVCSRHVIEEQPHHHAVYIDLIMVYDLKNDKPIRVVVRRSGYFLE